MGILFDDPLHERFATRALAQTLCRGAEFGECLVTAKYLTSVAPTRWHGARTATADRVVERSAR